MCEGGVATWNRSSAPRPRAVHQCAVAWPIDRWVWRTALGRPVVPELNTSTASAVPAAGAVAGAHGARLERRARRVVDVGDVPVRHAPAQDSARPRRRPRRGPARSTARAWPTSAAFHAGLTSTDAAPSLLTACTASTNSTRLAIMTATRSPAPDPPVREVPGQAVGPPVQLTEGPGAVARPNGHAVTESVRGALEATVHRTSSHGENILLYREIVVNTHGVYPSPMDDRPRAGHRRRRPARDRRDGPSVRRPRGDAGGQPTSSARTGSPPRSSRVCGRWGSSGSPSPRPTAGSGSTC